MFPVLIFGKQSWGIKSVRFSSKIKRKNQGRFSVIYTKLATISNNHWTVGTNQGCRKQHNLEAGSYVASEVASWPSSNLLFQKKNKRVGGRKGEGKRIWNFQAYQRNSKGNFQVLDVGAMLVQIFSEVATLIKQISYLLGGKVI